MQMLAPCFGQIVALTDVRDEYSYQTLNTNGTIWMLDNFNFVTDLSSALTSDQNEKYKVTVSIKKGVL